MLTLYRKPECSACDQVVDQLRELRLAHKIVSLDDAAVLVDPVGMGVAAGGEHPVLRDSTETFVGPQAIRQHLDEVARIKDRWQQHGSDACYCDE